MAHPWRCSVAPEGGQIETMDDKGHYIDAWDLLIAHPPCTYLSNAGARHLWKGHQLQADRVMLGIQGRDLFMLFCRADGKWAVYDDTYDITIHCESQQEQDDAVKMLERANECRGFSATGMLDKYVPKYPMVSAVALSRFCKNWLAAGKGCPGCPFDKPTSDDGDGECRLGVPSDWDI